MADGCDGEFQLAKDHAGGADESGLAVDGRAVHFAVGAGDDDDDVLAAVGDENGSDAGGAGDAGYGCGIDA